jgi:hypothetical protein
MLAKATLLWCLDYCLTRRKKFRSNARAEGRRTNPSILPVSR